jgi:hypothetical protein
MYFSSHHVEKLRHFQWNGRPIPYFSPCGGEVPFVPQFKMELLQWNCCKAAFVASGFIILKDKWESHGVFYAFCSTF